MCIIALSSEVKAKSLVALNNCFRKVQRLTSPEKALAMSLLSTFYFVVFKEAIMNPIIYLPYCTEDVLRMINFYVFVCFLN